MNRIYEFDVQMSCGGEDGPSARYVCPRLMRAFSGCASAVRKAVAAIPNVQTVDTSVEKQKVGVTVTNDVTFDQVKLAIQAAGKRVSAGRVVEACGVTEMEVEEAAKSN